MKVAAAVGIGAVTAVALIATVVAPASATKPERVRVGPSAYEFGGVCDFPIRYEETTNDGRLTFFSDGRMSGIGSYKVRITNLDDPSKSMDINATGPQWFYADGTNKLDGHQLFLLFGGIDYTTGIYLATGTMSYTRNDRGGIATLTGTGTLSGNLCARIA